MAEINRIHVSPGIYQSETVDMKEAARSVGITKVAAVGETLKGPAFQPYWIHAPREYASTFGGKSTERFKGNGFPKYELPYIAEEFLKKGKELCVVRTLGFSGYNAGPAWIITGHIESGTEEKVIAVLRSRGSYTYRPELQKTDQNGCPCQSAFDSLTYEVGEVTSVASCTAPKVYNMSAVSLSKYKSINSEGSECTSYELSGSEEGFDAYYGNLGRFTINCIVGPSEEGAVPGSQATSGQTVSIPVSLNKSDKDYILNVLGSRNDDGDKPLFVESLFDVAWEDLVINHGYDKISEQLATYNVAYPADFGGLQPIYGILTKYDQELSRKDVGKRLLFSSDLGSPVDPVVRYYKINYKTNTVEKVEMEASLTWAAATTSIVHIECGEAFEIIDGQYAGKWLLTSTQSGDIKEIVKSTAFGGTSTAYTVEALSESGLNAFKFGVMDRPAADGMIFTVSVVTDGSGIRHYVYTHYDEATTSGITDSTERLIANDRIKSIYETSAVDKRGTIVFNYEDGLYYKNAGTVTSSSTGTTSSAGAFTASASGSLFIDSDPNGVKLFKNNSTEEVKVDGTYWNVTQGTAYTFSPAKAYKYTIYPNQEGKILVQNKVVQVTTDINDYKASYRYSSTPWVVSNAKGDANHIELNRLFRFHTISDGTASVSEVKVSIENIRTDNGTFDVIVRPYGDSDNSVNVLERFSKCTLKKGKNFIGYQIGTLDGQYESKSKYIMVEVMEGSAVENSVPAGFLGYPMPMYNGEPIVGNANENVSVAPMMYNTSFNEEVSKRKQYFGISDIVGYDVDYFTFKGNMACLEEPGFVTDGFHLDSRLDLSAYKNEKPVITVDGMEGYTFDTVSVNARTSTLPGTPIIASEDAMIGSIYEDVRVRKFTMVFAGGFDGWDEYRDERTNTDDFSYGSYKGYIGKTSGVGYAFDMLSTKNDAESYGIEGQAITSDYYSTLAGVSLLKNPEEVDINVLVTPGIDTINNTKLVNEVFDILEDRADTLYIPTTPDTYNGGSEYADDIIPEEEVVAELEEKELYSDYATTYYPWVKVEDNGEYIWLPVTKDVVRNLAESDNGNTTMNLAPAGKTRGRVEGIRARKNLKVGECDELYDNNVNPVRTFAEDGILIFGQKTMRAEDDLANRVDVRRMVMRIRKLIAIGTLGLIFEPNDASTVNSFRSIVNGIMKGFVDNRAVRKWHMDIDESVEARDRHEINAVLYVMPVGALEYININLVITNNGVYFES